jgi:O-antigen/teichoic acid export membrane protein
MPQIRRAVVLVLLLLGPYCLVLAVMPRFILSKVFDPSYAEQPLVLSLYSIESMLNYLALIVVAALSARRMTREIFFGSVWSCAIAVMLSWPLIRLMGVGGAVACMMVSTVAMSAFLANRLVVKKEKKNPAAKATSPARLFVEEQACPS